MDVSRRDGEAGMETGIRVAIPSVNHRGIVGYRDHVDVEKLLGPSLQDVLAGAQLECLHRKAIYQMSTDQEKY